MTKGFYWPTMKQLSKLFIKNCDTYQKFRNIIHASATTLHSMESPWPFYKWGTDIVGMLPQAIGKRKFILVAIDYFKKWVEADAYAQIKANHLTKFVQRNIICQFGVHHSIVSNNGPWFINKSYQQFCTEYGIKNVYSTPRYP